MTISASSASASSPATVPTGLEHFFDGNLCVRVGCGFEGGVDPDDQACSGVMIDPQYMKTCSRTDLKKFVSEWGLDPKAKKMMDLRKMLKERWIQTGLMEPEPEKKK